MFHVLPVGASMSISGAQAVPKWNSPVRGKQLFSDRWCMRIARRYRFSRPAIESQSRFKAIKAICIRYRFAMHRRGVLACSVYKHYLNSFGATPGAFQLDGRPPNTINLQRELVSCVARPYRLVGDSYRHM